MNSSILLYGKGVFTTVSIRHREPFLWAKHWSRLQNNAAAVGIDISEHTEVDIRSALDELIRKENLVQGRARITFVDVSPSRMWSGSGKRRTELLINTGSKRPRSAQLKLALSPHMINSTSPLAGVKSCNYLEHLMSYEEARREGFDEAIRLNEIGHVTSACMANVFWEEGGKLYTPSLSTGCLAGTTREFVMENLECEEVEAGIENFESADRIFLTSAGLGIAPVAEFNGRPLNVSDHQILQLIPE
jgi:branched-chain amino acid aminotransferase